MVYFYCFYLCVWGAGERVHASAGVCGGQRCLILLEPELKTLVVRPLWCGCLQQNSGPGQAHMLPATEPSCQPEDVAQTDLKLGVLLLLPLQYMLLMCGTKASCFQF